MSESFTFRVRVNEGEEQELTVNTGIYQYAAVAVPAILGYDDLPIVVEIWSPYGRYHYIIRQNEYGNIQAVLAVPNPTGTDR